LISLKHFKPIEVDQREFLAENVRESALGDAPHQRHLPALETEPA
jgi:hypothetical protein